MTELTKEQKITIIEASIEKLNLDITEFICECLRYEYRKIDKTGIKLNYNEVLKMFPEVVALAPKNVKVDLEEIYGPPWFGPSEEGNRQRIELLEKVLITLKA